MIDIVGTGLSGLVGSRIIELLSSRYTCTNISKETGYDITDRASIENIISTSPASWIFHFAAYTNVAEAEKDKEKGVESDAWKVNVLATKSIADSCHAAGKKLLYISTDYVFDGEKELYDEEDAPHPISFYGLTKWEGEKVIQESHVHACIIRISTPYRSHPVGKKDFVHKIGEVLQSGNTVQSPSDQWFSPTFIDDLAHAIDIVVTGNKEGIYHVPASVGITPYEAAKEIAHTFGYDERHVLPVLYTEYYKGKALAPKRSVLKHDKIDALGIKLHTFSEGIAEVKKQEMIDGV